MQKHHFLRLGVTLFLCGYTALAPVFISAKTVQKHTLPPPQFDQSPAWSKEPDSFLGFKFGQAIPASLPACPNYGSPSQNPGDLCGRSAVGMPLVSLEGLPSLGNDRPLTVSLMTDDDRMVVAILRGSSMDFPALKKTFLYRYGEPTKTEQAPVSSKGGTVLTAETDRWIGKNVSIEMNERFNTIGEMWIFVRDNAYTKKQAALRQQQEAKAADRL